MGDVLPRLKSFRSSPNRASTAPPHEGRQLGQRVSALSGQCEGLVEVSMVLFLNAAMMLAKLLPLMSQEPLIIVGAFTDQQAPSA